ncbi:MAG: DUF1320 domain-containing protein [bacterium]|nr:DUF1320 domain-containing protein [bacterium]
MAYVTNDDIETRLGTTRYLQLTDDADTGSADPDLVSEVRNGAERLADSFLARRYSVPVDLAAVGEAAALLVSVVLDLIEYRLHCRRPPVPKDVAEKNQGALGWLEQLAGGKVDLPGALPSTGDAVPGFSAASTGDARVLSREELKGY